MPIKHAPYKQSIKTIPVKVGTGKDAILFRYKPPSISNPDPQAGEESVIAASTIFRTTPVADEIEEYIEFLGRVSCRNKCERGASLAPQGAVSQAFLIELSSLPTYEALTAIAEAIVADQSIPASGRDAAFARQTRQYNAEHLDAVLADIEPACQAGLDAFAQFDWQSEKTHREAKPRKVSTKTLETLVDDFTSDDPTKAALATAKIKALSPDRRAALALMIEQASA